jgi:lipopolysaccharide transport protein LptA
MKNLARALIATLLIPAISLATPEPQTSSPATPVDNELFSADFNKAPTEISANSLTLRSKERKFEYNGSVVVKQGEMTLAADLLEGSYDEQNQIQQLIARNNVKITKGEKIKANSNRAVYKKASETIELTENPQIEQQGSVLTADKVTIFLKEDRSNAEGRVHVKLLNDTAIETPK